MKQFPLLPLAAVAVLSFTTSASAAILIDYDDGDAGNGIHDTTVSFGDFGTAAGVNIQDQPGWALLVLGGSSDSGDTKTDNASGVGTSANLLMSGTTKVAFDTGYTLGQTGTFDFSYYWRDAANWDNDDHVQMVLYYTDNDLIGNLAGATDLLTLNSGNRASSASWEIESVSSAAFSDVGADGKNLFVRFESNNGGTTEYYRMDNVYLEAVAIPEPSSFALLACFGLAWVMVRRRG